VQKIYRGQVRDIKHELSCYKELSDINYEIWSANNNSKQTVIFKDSVRKLSPASKELKESKRYLLKALDYIYLAQEKSRLSVSQLNLEADQEKFALPKEYLEKADIEANRSKSYLEKFEENHKELF
jgi:hypothetical protein